MSDKLAVILVSAARKVLEMGLVYAKNVVAKEWMDDMRLFFFGPSEVTIASDADLQVLGQEIVAGGTIPRVCRWCSDKYKVSGMLEELGCMVEYVGSPVSEAIKAGYTPMTWQRRALCTR